MSCRRVEDAEPISDKTLINKNHALEDEIKNLRARLEEAEELQRAISEGDLDALVIPRPEGELIFTLNSADHAYRVLVETMNEGTATLGFDGTILYCNRRFAELLRMQPQDIVSKSIYRFIVPEDLAIFRALLERKKNSGEVKLHATGGKSIPVYLSISSMQAEESQNAWCIVVTDLTDITEHMKNEEVLKKAYEEIQAKSEEIQVQNEELQAQSEELHEANEALLESEERYRTLFQSMGEGFAIAEIEFDLEGKPVDYVILEINQAYERHTGLRPEKVIGRRVTEFLDRVEPVWFEPYGRVIISGEPQRFEEYNVSLDRWFSIYAFPLPIRNRFGMIFSDITERKKAEEELRESEAHLQTTLCSIQDEVWIVDAQGCVVMVNQAVETNLGVSQDLWKDIHAAIADLEIFYPDGTPRPSEMAPLARSLRGETLVSEQEIVKHLSSSELRWREVSCAPIRDPQERITGAVLVARDITERKRAEDELRESEARIKISEAIEAERHLLFGVLEALPAMVCLLTPDYHYAFTNRAFREKFGEPGTRHCYECCFGLDKPCDFCEAYKVLETGQPHYWEVTTPDGSIIDVYNYPFADVDGSPMILEMDFDITERKKAEENIRRLANIVESSNDAIVTKSLDGIITSWNKGAEQLYGYSAEEVLGKPVSILEPPTLSDETKKLIKMIKQRAENKQYETLRIRKDGKVINVSIALSPVFDINGKMTAISVIARDITKRKEAEEALAKIEIARKKEIHHRIKNNLQVISSLLDLQAEQFRDKECINDSEVLEAFRESQDRVISMALIHEELYKGGGFETLNFSPYIQELTESLFQTYRLGNVDISLKLNLVENTFFDMDLAVPLGIIVNELVTNSFKHAFKGRGSGVIHIKLDQEENEECLTNVNEDCTTFVLTVSDNGIGIPEDIQVEELDSLGMQLVITLVDQLDGELEIKRENGTEFTVRFTVPENNNSTKEASLPRMADND